MTEIITVGIIVIVIAIAMYYIKFKTQYVRASLLWRSYYTTPGKQFLEKLYILNKETRKLEKNWGDDNILVISLEMDKLKTNDVLVFKKYRGQSIKDNYVILENQEGEQRIAYCKSESYNLPPIFDNSETLIDHKIIGVLNSSYSRKDH